MNPIDAQNDGIAGAVAHILDAGRLSGKVEVVKIPVTDTGRNGMVTIDVPIVIGTDFKVVAGNCRLAACALPNLWRVQYFNSMDTLILDTVELTALPEIVCAAPEDLADSRERLAEIRTLYA